jgi:hypothetical protein
MSMLTHSELKRKKRRKNNNNAKPHRITFAVALPRHPAPLRVFAFHSTAPGPRRCIPVIFVA